MKRKTIVIASDSFKGTLSSLDICHLYQEALKDYRDINIKYFPIADGGEGSLEAISIIKEGCFIDVEARDLYQKPRKTQFYLDKEDNVYIETASCVGLTLAHEDNDPGMVTTYGLGEQIRIAINKGYKNIYVFLGGSASNDGGVGLANALGVKFFNQNNEEFLPMGLTIKDIHHIDNKAAKELLKDIHIHALSDVKSPFYGLKGAAYKFAKQKGANENEIAVLDEGLRHLSEIIKRDLHIDISNKEGAGAAGGLGGGLIAFTNASITSGINTILDLGKFDEVIKDADLIISGEGRLDNQTFEGKVIDGVAHRCLKQNKSLALVVGISNAPIKEVQKTYPCVIDLLETNDKHLPFEEVKNTAKRDYLIKINQLFADIKK